MSTICLIRPGATAFDLEGRIKGCLDMPLCESGQAEASRTATEISEKLVQMGVEQRLDVVYSAPCQSAVATAQIIAGRCGGKMKEIDCLRNVDHGLWQGRLIEEVRRLQPKLYKNVQEHPMSFAPPGGETLDNARRRVRRCIDRLVRRHKTGIIGLVIPDPLATLVRQLLAAGELRDIWKAEEDHANWDWIAVQADQLAMV